MSKSMLSPDVIDIFAKPKVGFCLVQRMLNRHAGYKNLPLPFRAKALHKKAEELGLVERTRTVRVDASTVRNDCNMAEGRKKMKMTDEIGRDCKRVVMLQTKKNNAFKVSLHKRPRQDLQTSPKYGETFTLIRRL
jgi:hypothetical protein